MKGDKIMVKFFSKALEEEELTIGEVCAFVTIDAEELWHLYVVGDNCTIIELTSNTHSTWVFEENTKLDSILVSYSEKLIKAYTNTKDFEIIFKPNERR